MTKYVPTSYLHSGKILMIQGLPRGVSSIGNPQQPFMGLTQGSMVMLRFVYEKCCVFYDMEVHRLPCESIIGHQWQ